MLTRKMKSVISSVLLGSAISSVGHACESWPTFCLGSPARCITPGYPQVTNSQEHKELCEQVCHGEWVYLGGWWSYASGCAYQ